MFVDQEPITSQEPIATKEKKLSELLSRDTGCCRKLSGRVAKAEAVSRRLKLQYIVKIVHGINSRTRETVHDGSRQFTTLFTTPSQLLSPTDSGNNLG